MDTIKHIRIEAEVCEVSREMTGRLVDRLRAGGRFYGDGSLPLRRKVPSGLMPDLGGEWKTGYSGAGHSGRKSKTAPRKEESPCPPFVGSPC